MATRSFDRVAQTMNGQRVEFRRLNDEELEIRKPGGTVEISEFVYIGRIAGGALDLWKENGRWRESEKPHPLDLAIAASK